MISQTSPVSGKDREVAVIVVHGVGASDPGHAAEQFSSALVNALREPQGQLPLVQATTLNLPLTGVQLPPTPDGALPAEDVLLRRQLGQYAGAGQHETLTVPSYSIRSGRSDLPALDVYALWWGDIGSFGAGAARALVYVLRLITRLAALGLTTIEAAGDATHLRFWKQAEWWQRSFAIILFGVVPTLTLMLALTVGATQVAELSFESARMIAALVAVVILVSPTLPAMIGRGDAGPGWWAGVPLMAAGVVAVLVLELTDTPAGPRPSGALAHETFTPWLVLLTEMLVAGAVTVWLVREFMSIGDPAPRWPAGLERPAPAPAPELQRTYKETFAVHMWLVGLIAMLAGSDSYPELITLYLGMALFAVTFGNASAFRRFFAARGAPNRIAAAVAMPLVRSVGILVATVMIAAGLNADGATLAVLFAAVALVVAAADVVVAAREPGATWQRTALIVIGTGAATAWPLALESRLVPLCALVSGSVVIAGCAASMERYWRQVQPAAVPPVTLRQRVNAHMARYWPAWFAAVFVLFALGSFIQTAHPELSPGKGGVLAITNTAQVTALTAAVRELQAWLAIALPAMWFAAAAIVVVQLGIALVMTVRSMKAWAENRAFVGTLWTNVITSSATFVMVLIAFSWVSHVSGVETVLERRKAAADSAAAAVAAAQPQSVVPVPASVDTSGNNAVNKKSGAASRTSGRERALNAATTEALDTLDLLSRWADYQLIVALAFGGLLIVVAAWTLLPSVLADASETPRPWGSSTQLGRWLTTGWTSIIVLAAIGVPLVAIAAAAFAGNAGDSGDVLETLTRKITDMAFGGVVGAGFAVILTQAGNIVLVMRPVLALAADIEIYLRVAPADRTPRARLLERLLTLISHVERAGYRRIIVVAHSQGTVITSDALRLRRRLDAAGMIERQSGTPAPRISLVTMGSPLTHLYASAFPYLYGWVQDTEADVEDGVVNAGRVGAAQWINLFRSGDYIGRHLWFTGPIEERYHDNSALVAKRSASGESFDTCIGYGGHTGYWHDRAVVDAVLGQTRIKVEGRTTAAMRAFKSI